MNSTAPFKNRTIDSPLVSIIVVELNPCRLVRVCLENIIRGTSIPYELIAVVRPPVEALRNHFKKYQKIRMIGDFKASCFAESANRGILEARGKYLCFLQADILVLPGWMDFLLEIFEQPKVNAVLTAAKAPSQIKNLCFIATRTAISCVGLFNKQSSFEDSVNDYALRLRARGYKLAGTKSTFLSFQKKSNRLKRLRTNGQDHLEQEAPSQQRRGVSQIATEWRLRQYLLSHHKAYTPSQSLPTLPTRPVPVDKITSHPIRTGFSVLSRNSKRIEALASLSSLEIFSPDPQYERLWELLDGSRSIKEITALVAKQSLVPKKYLINDVRKRIEKLMKLGLVTRIGLSPAPSILATVMMPAHNAECWIRGAIESVLAQTFRCFELIIVDDGSADQTFQIAQRYLWDSRVKLLKNPKQLGVSATRNRILSLAQGKYIAVCDADDLMRPTLLERFVGLLETHPEVGWVYSERLKIDVNGHSLAVDAVLPKENHRRFRRNIVAHAGSLIRREVMVRAGGYNETLLSAEDYVLALQMAKFTRFLALPGEIHYLWRRHSESISSTDPWARCGPDLQTVKLERHLMKCTK